MQRNTVELFLANLPGTAAISHINVKICTGDTKGNVSRRTKV